MKDMEHLVSLFQSTQQVLQKQAVRAVDSSLVVRNWLFGWYLVEFENADAERSELYGKHLIDDLSKRLNQTGLKGISPTNLRRFREFFLSYQKIQQTLSVESLKPVDIAASEPSNALPSEISQTLSDQSLRKLPQNALRQIAARFPLSWSHYVALLSVSNPDERSFYEIESTANDWSLRELKRQINSSLFERLALSRDKDQLKALAQQGQIVEQAADLVKNPYVLEFLGLDERTAYSENELETAIIDKLEHFLLELGKGFLFEARQKRFTFDEDHYFIDLVFYNRLLRCYALIDLKIGEITHQDLGQMQMYVNYYDRHVKTDAEAPTIGIVLCKRKKDALVEITLPKDSNIHASEYKLYLPSKDELIAQIDSVSAQIEDGGSIIDNG
ncbi:PDDEXK nuclease domain-containing protein [Coraliomargarita sp. SDUM461003]|uniref:PDDEXK nuclease domain-containing protein n=2 Tax=Thalassobacterium maritimum TaxID=3041265 RepID=A0ABU1AUZ9_9BACT|nr:PDDEXK nuclease domain-containing protein [Coraliomargarita sp. SDUM461003]